MAVACAALTAVVLIGASIARVSTRLNMGVAYEFDASGENLVPQGVPFSPLLTDVHLRPGLVVAAALACLPPIVLLLQALRVGSLARERRLTALRTVGASRTHLRRLAGSEGATAGLAGALAGTVGYLLAGLASAKAPTQYLRVVPALDVHDVWLIPLVVVGVTALAGLAARRSVRDVVVAPQRVAHTVRPLPRRRAVAAVACGATAALVLVASVQLRLPLLLQDAGAVLVIALFVATLLLGAPFIALAAARRSARGGDAMAVLAAARVAADPRTPARAAAVVAVCAATIAVAGVVGVDALARTWQPDASASAFVLSGVGLALAMALVALLICLVSLVVGATEQMRDGARSTAVLVAFGVGRADLHRALVRQLTAVTLPSASIGAVVAALAVTLFTEGTAAMLGGVLGVAVAVLAVAGAARLAALLVRPQIAEATSADHLRTA
ncbi:MAG TPA: FtsX-like permease family protein [Actinomycetales bacterium]